MSALLSVFTAKGSNKNNFNLLRFIAAILILTSLGFTLTSGIPNLDPLYHAVGLTLADVGVDIFLIISGFLITNSYYKLKDSYGFIGNRVLKVMPQLIIATLLSVFAGLLFTTQAKEAYLLSSQTLLFLFKNITLVFGTQSTLPATFTNNPIESVNGNLWMLSYLVGLYAVLFSVFKLTDVMSKYDKHINAKNIVLLLAVDALVLHLLNHQNVIFAPIFTHFFAMFTIGASFSLWQDKLRISSAWIGMTLPLLMASALFPSYFYNVYYLCLPFLVLYLAFVPKGTIRQFNRLGKYAYGLFLYAYPVQQVLIAIAPNITAKPLIAVSLVLTLVLTMFTQHIAEQNTLGFKRWLKRIVKFWLRRLRVIPS